MLHSERKCVGATKKDFPKKGANGVIFVGFFKREAMLLARGHAQH
jgi:hypothetical protein